MSRNRREKTSREDLRARSAFRKAVAEEEKGEISGVRDAQERRSRGNLGEGRSGVGKENALRGFPFFDRNAALFHKSETLGAGDVFRFGNPLGALPAQAEIPAPAVVVGKAATS